MAAHFGRPEQVQTGNARQAEREKTSCDAAGVSLFSPSFSAREARGRNFVRPVRLAGSQRVLVAVAGVGLVAMFVIAALLTPDPSGRGTHRQLGLSPCSFSAWFGRPCPSCGMTTAWSHLVRGEVTSACRANVAGTLLAVWAILAAPWALVSAVRGEYVLGRPNQFVFFVIAAAIFLIALAQWAVRLWPV